MNSFMRLVVPALVAAALLISPAVSAAAEPFLPEGQKPPIVLSFASVDKALGNIGYLARTAGVGGIGAVATHVLAPLAAEMDRTRPCGVLITFDGGDFKSLGFFPVKNLDKLLKGLEEDFGEAKDAGDGVLEIEGPYSVFVKQRGEWTFVALQAETVKNPPADPVALLGGLEKQYDAAVRIDVAAVPQEKRQWAIDQMRGAFNRTRKLIRIRGVENEGALDPAERQRRAEERLAELVKFVEQTNHMTYGLKIDRAKKVIEFESEFTALPGTALAKELEEAGKAQSRFAGFALPDAAIAARFTPQVTPRIADAAVARLKTFHDRAKEQIERDPDLADKADREKAHQVLDELVAVATGTIKGGKLDGGLVVMLDKEHPSWVAGGHVADTARLEKAVADLFELAQREPGVQNVKMNAVTHAGVRFHTASVAVKRPKLQDALGENLDVAVGIGQQSVYLAFGPDGLNLAKRVIDESATAQGPQPPVHVRVAVRPVVDYLARFDDRVTARLVSELLKSSEAPDHVSFVIRPVPAGFANRTEIGESALEGVALAGQAIAADIFLRGFQGLPPGAVPPGAFPPGFFPPGALPPGALPPGEIPPGLFPPGFFPPGTLPKPAPNP